MYFDRKALSDETLIHIFRCLLWPRMIEEKMLVLLRQNKISKWFSGIGQEAIAVGATLAMDEEEWILPLHRNLGVFTTRGMPLHRLYAQWKGLPQGYSKGRERSFHFGSHAHHIFGMISHLGSQLSVADGIALADKLSHSGKATLVFTGEGGTSEGEFHEALNVASVWDLPVIFLIENNGYAISTPTTEQYRCERLSDRAVAYGMQGITIDGNNVLEVYHAVQQARQYCISTHKPVLIECLSFRIRGHEEASGTRYVPPELITAWKAKDPVDQYAHYLLQEKVLTAQDIQDIRTEFQQQIEQELQLAEAYHPSLPDIDSEVGDVYAPTPPLPLAISGKMREKKFIEAIHEALEQAMQEHPELILMGQDIAEYGGVFKVTEGLLAQFGKQRVRNTPLCESAIVGTALGLSVKGYKSVVEMQYADFVSCAFHQIVNNLAKIHYRWGHAADVVIRMPTGAGLSGGPFHSQSNEAWFFHVPGLKIVYPATPEDAKGLLIAAIEDPNPVLYFEHKALYRRVSGLVPEAYYAVPIGEARVVAEGEECTVVAYGAAVHWALDYAAAHPETDIEIIDLRSLLPLDMSTIERSVKKTGRVLVFHEDTLVGGIGAEISARITESCFSYLDAPVMRCASLDTPVPFAPHLEAQFLAKSRFESILQQLLAY
ncbi:MAG: dehydrogenase E1 component subunit alpha/beta [Thermoflavifilum sp.]|nr:dehydrogenase E1 component subunit alpha/beta [Thermoflavifilum sp.]